MSRVYKCARRDPLIFEQVPSDRASFILNARVSRRHGSLYEIKQGKKKILIRVPSPGFGARINRACAA